MATDAYDLESEPTEKLKTRITFTEDDHKHISEMSVGDKMSMLVSGRICEMRKGYGKDKKMEAVMEVDKMDNMKMMGKNMMGGMGKEKEKGEEHNGKDS